MCCLGKCVEVRLELPRYSTISEFFVLQLEEFDVVLGIQWLKTMGSIIWNFETLQMSFTHNEKKVELQGQITSPNQLCNRKQLCHSFKKRQGLLISLLSCKRINLSEYCKNLRRLFQSQKRCLPKGLMTITYHSRKELYLCCW